VTKKKADDVSYDLGRAKTTPDDTALSAKRAWKGVALNQTSGWSGMRVKVNHQQLP